MRRVYKIAVVELKQLFCSPLAYLILVLFCLVCSERYFSRFEMWLMGEEAMNGMDGVIKSPGSITSRFMSHPSMGYIKEMLHYLYLFFPLLTMGLVSRDLQHGTIRLFQSSPVFVREVVWGKYLAMVGFALVFVLAYSTLFVSLSLSVLDVDWGIVFGTTLGVFLLFCLYSAIGLFFSTLTTYQLVAAVLTMACFILLQSVGRSYQQSIFWGDVFYFLDINRRVGNFAKGLITSKDLIYLLVITGSFLSFCMLRLTNLTIRLPRKLVTLRIVGVIAISSLLVWLGNQPRLAAYWDTTYAKSNTISPKTQDWLIKMADEPLRVTIYVNLLSDQYFALRPAAQREVYSELLEQYERFRPDMEIAYRYYYEIDSATSKYTKRVLEAGSLMAFAEQYATSWRHDFSTILNPAEIRDELDVDRFEKRSVMKLGYRDTAFYVNFPNPPSKFPDEENMASALFRFFHPAPSIQFAKDELEPSIFIDAAEHLKSTYNLKGLPFSLINNGYDLDSLSTSLAVIPVQTDALAIVDPRVDFSDLNLQRIRRFMEQGGNLFLAFEPDRADVVRPLLAELGVGIKDGMILEPKEGIPSDLVFNTPSEFGLAFKQISGAVEGQRQKPGGMPYPVVQFWGPAALEYEEKDGFAVWPLLETDAETSFLRSGQLDADSLFLTLARNPDDQAGPFHTALKLERKVGDKQQKIIIVSDADFLKSDKGLGPVKNGFNATGAFRESVFFYYFQDGILPASGGNKAPKDVYYKINTARLQAHKPWYFVGLPFLIVLVGSVVIVRRNRR